MPNGENGINFVILSPRFQIQLIHCLQIELQLYTLFPTIFYRIGHELAGYALEVLILRRYLSLIDSRVPIL